MKIRFHGVLASSLLLTGALCGSAIVSSACSKADAKRGAPQEPSGKSTPEASKEITLAITGMT